MVQIERITPDRTSEWGDYLDSNYGCQQRRGCWRWLNGQAGVITYCVWVDG
jgi:hypothetical protein